MGMKSLAFLAKLRNQAKITKAEEQSVNFDFESLSQSSSNVYSRSKPNIVKFIRKSSMLPVEPKAVVQEEQEISISSPSDDDLDLTSESEGPTIAERLSGIRQRVSMHFALQKWNKKIVQQRNQEANEEYELLTMAMNGKWSQLEDMLLVKVKRYDSRLNVVDRKTEETILMVACRQQKFLVVRRLCYLSVRMNVRSRDRRTALHYATATGNDPIVRELIQNKADPNLIGGVHLQLPLHIAASQRLSFQSAQLLLHVGLKHSVLVKDRQGNLPVTYAVVSGNVMLVREMLKVHSMQQVSWESSGDHEGDTLLHLATRYQRNDVIEVLLAEIEGVDINRQNHEGQTALHIATEIGNMSLVMIFYRFKAHPDIADRKGRTPLHIAADCGHASLVRFLIEKFKAQIQLRTRNGSTLMHLAAEKGYDVTVLSFIKLGLHVNMPNKSGTLCLHLAALNGHEKVLEVLVTHGSSINAKNKEGYTALHLAVLQNKPLIIQKLLGFGTKVDIQGGVEQEAPLHIAAKSVDGYDCAELLIISGANVNNQTGITGDSPLHHAARNGTPLVERLLEEGANPAAVNKSGETPLHVSVRHCHYQTVKSLLDFINAKRFDASINLVNIVSNEGETPFHLAVELAKSQCHQPFEETDMIRLLLQNGADVFAVSTLTKETPLHYCARSGNAEILQEIVHHLRHRFQHGCNRQDMLGFSPLMTASEQGHLNLVETLLSNSVRVDVFDEFGRAAIHLAAENGHIGCCITLLKRKAFVNAKSKLGMTAVHFAALNGWSDLIKLLVRTYKAKVNALTLDMKTPLHLAAANGRYKTSHILMHLGANANALDASGHTPMHLAAENNHADVVKIYLRYIPQTLAIANKKGEACVHIAAINGSAAVIREIIAFKSQLVTAMKNSIDGSLPIHLAVSRGHKHVVRQLIQAGASTTAENSEGMTSIHLAAKEADIEVLKSIPEKISRKAISRKNGLAAVHIASFYGNANAIREIQTKVDLNQKTIAPKVASVIQDSNLRRLISMDFGLTPLHIAAFMGCENVIRLLLNDQSVRVDEKSRKLERYPLFYAAMNGQSITVSLLLSRSAEHIGATDFSKRRPLHLAAENGHADIVDMLLAQGADINCMDENDWTPLHFASQNGHLDIVRQLTRAGARSDVIAKDNETALRLAVAGVHIELIGYLLKRPNNSTQLLEDRTFLMNLMLCGRNNSNKTVEDFIANSELPLFSSVILANAYRDMAAKERGRAKDLNELSRHLERYTSKLLDEATTKTDPTVLMVATDSKGNRFLDLLIKFDMREVTHHPVIQKYLSEIWKGSLSKWSATSLFLLLIGFLLFPPLVFYFCFPFHTHGYHQIPVIKYLGMITSNLYVIVFQSMIAAVPVNPSVYRQSFLPDWLEIVYLALVSGMIITELTKAGFSSGLGMLRLVIIFFTIVSVICQVVAIFLNDLYGWRSDALMAMYFRNFMLSFALFASISLTLDFLLIHHRFGPFGILLRTVMRDLIVFIVVIAIFLLAFTFMTACLFAPIYGNSTSTTRLKNKPIQPTTVTPSICKPHNVIIRREKWKDPEQMANYNKYGQFIRRGSTKYRTIDNSERSTLIHIFDNLYFGMFGLSSSATLPRVRNGPKQSEEIHLLFSSDVVKYADFDDEKMKFVSRYLPECYFGAWMLVSALTLIPLLIAMLTDTYKRIHMRSDLEWKFGRAKLIQEMVQMPSTPTPWNLLVRPYLYLRATWYNGCDNMLSKYAQYYILREELPGSHNAPRRRRWRGGIFKSKISDKKSLAAARIATTFARRSSRSGMKFRTKPNIQMKSAVASRGWQTVMASIQDKRLRTDNVKLN